MDYKKAIVNLKSYLNNSSNKNLEYKTGLLSSILNIFVFFV